MLMAVTAAFYLPLTVLDIALQLRAERRLRTKKEKEDKALKRGGELGVVG